MFKGLKQDINAVKERDPAAPSSLQILLIYSGLHAIMWHRPAYWLWNRGHRFLARALSQIVRKHTGIEIHPAAKIGQETGKRHPTLGKNVTVGCGAKVLGPFSVGDGAKIAANAVVLSEIPEYATAVGVPARVVRQYGRRLEQLDQVHMPDPVSQEFCRLQMENDRLQKEIDELHKFHDGNEHEK